MFFRDIFALIFIVVSIEAFNKILEKNVYRFKPTVCRTDDCKTMANVIISTMNRTADPCEDFYEYACGAWIHSNETLPPDQPTWNRFEMFNKVLSKKLRRILESNNVDEIPMEKAKQWYRSCMDEETRESRGILPLTSITIAVGGWPIAMALGEWNPLDYSWQAIELYYSRMMGSYAMYDLVITMNRHNTSVNEISLKSASLPLSKVLSRNYFDPQDREPYGKLITGVVKAFAAIQGTRLSDEKIAREVNDMIEFEVELDKVMSKRKNEDGKVTYRISRTQQLLDEVIPNTEISKINLLKLVENLVEGIGEIEITEEERITVEALYLADLSDLLNKTSFRTIVNYIHWHYLSRLLHTTNSEMRNLLIEFKKETLGTSKALPRWEQCVNQMELKHALSYQFVLEHFTEDISNSGSEMISKIQAEMARQINESTWMNDKTKESLIDKLWNVKMHIGFPDWYKNITNLEQYYEGLTIDNDYFNNVIGYMRFEQKKIMRTLRVTDGLPEWALDPITINALYIAQTNGLNIPAADLQPPLFTPMMPNAVKYGIIGSILGHELSHGFDDTGYQFNKNGKFVNWPDDMTNSYTQRAQCFVDQYNNLTIASATDEIFYSSHKAEENFADTTGVQAALSAYKTIVRENIKGDRKLPGLGNMSNEQLFLLSYGTLWCEMSTPQYSRKKPILHDKHSSARVRTLATMLNTKGFAEAFNCPKGSPMNPETKCNIWIGSPMEE